MTARRARLVLVLVVLGVVGVLARNLLTPIPPPPHVRPTFSELFFGDSELFLGEPRFADGIHTTYFVQTGFKASEYRLKNGQCTGITHWDLRGRVVQQRRNTPETPAAFYEGAYCRTSSPWWWNVTDQTAPSMPEWMKDDEKWQAALDAQD